MDGVLVRTGRAKQDSEDMGLVTRQYPNTPTSGGNPSSTPTYCPTREGSGQNTSLPTGRGYDRVFGSRVRPCVDS